MPSDISFAINYFTEEKITNLIIGIIGILSIAFALFFLFIIKYSFFKGMAIPLLVFGVLQVSVGSIVYLRTSKDIFKFEQSFKEDPEKLRLSELSKTETVIHNSHIYQWIELFLIITGIVLFIKFYRSPITFWKGLALGLLIQTSIVFAIAKVGEERAEEYLQALETHI